MTLIVEDGTGVRSAASYATTAFVDAYWGARTHSSLYTTWSAATNTTAKKEGGAREATAYIDAVWGPYFRGSRRGNAQGLQWPRTGALDDDGFPLLDLPPELQAAVAELAARAITAALGADIDTAKVVRRVKAGSAEVEFAPNASAAPRKNYGVVEDILAPLLDGSQGGRATWPWR